MPAANDRKPNGGSIDTGRSWSHLQVERGVHPGARALGAITQARKETRNGEYDTKHHHHVGITALELAAFASWTTDRHITSVQVADACGTVAGQYAVIVDNAGVAYWITSNADNFSSVVEMAQRALIYGRVVDLYSRPESYAVQTQRRAGECHTGGTIANRVSILSIR